MFAHVDRASVGRMKLDRPVSPDPHSLLPRVAPPEDSSTSIVNGAPDAPTPSGFWHWLLVGIPAEVTTLEAGAGTAENAPRGAFHVASDFSHKRYDGAAPPAGDRDHRYLFAVHPLDTDELGRDDTASAAVTALHGRPTPARGLISATYSA